MTNLSPNLSEPINPQELVSHRKLIAEKLEEARAHLKAKRYKASLKAYRWVFANCDSERAPLYSGDAARLARKYPPAQMLLRRWRNDKEKLIFAGNRDSRLINEWASLNEALKDQNRTLMVFRTLVAQAAEERTIDSMYHAVWKQLLHKRLYEELRHYLPHVGWLVFLHSSEVDTLVLFPDEDTSKKDRKYWLEFRTETLITHGAQAFEIAIGLNEVDIAREFARKLTTAEASDRCYSLLVKAACRARNFDEAQKLFEEALQTVKSRRIPLTRKAILKVPKSKRKVAP